MHYGVIVLTVTLNDRAIWLWKVRMRIFMQFKEIRYPGRGR